MNNPLSERSTSWMRLYEALGIVKTLPLRDGESGAEKRDKGASDAVDEGESQTSEGPKASVFASECVLVVEEDPTRDGPNRRNSVNAFVMLAGMFTLATTSPVARSSVVTCSVYDLTDFAKPAT